MGIETDSGKTGYIDYIDYRLASEGESDRESRLAKEAAAKTAKAVCDRKGGVAIGMSREEVYASCWGRPNKINVTRTAGGDHEQLVYGIGLYVYLTNGKVTAIQGVR